MTSNCILNFVMEEFTSNKLGLAYVGFLVRERESRQNYDGIGENVFNICYIYEVLHVF